MVSDSSGPRLQVHVALLIDGENISADHAPEILRIAGSVGGLQVRRVYGDATRLPSWDAVAGLRLVHAGRGKNATDVLLAIDAMEIALSEDCAAVVIASSDGDFTHLALRLRERGIMVVGIGEAKAPESFRQSCTVFHAIQAVASTHADVERPTSSQNGGPSEIDKKIRKLISGHSKGGGGMELKMIGVLMSRNYGVKISTMPERNWRRYFRQREALYHLDPPGPEARVRFLPKGFNGC